MRLRALLRALNEETTMHRSYLPFAFLAFYCGWLFLYGLGDRDLTSSHEARAAQNAQMILDEQHWLVPRLFDQHLELQKPPLYYWLVALIAWMRGGIVDAWAVRLPAALSACGTVFCLYGLGVRTGRRLAGWLAALMLASCLHFTWLAHVGRIDMPLTMVVTMALGAFYLGNRPEAVRRLCWHALGYTALAAGLLLKGPIAVALPAVVAGACWFARAGWNWPAHVAQLRATTLWWGIPWMAVIAGPWYLWANVQTHDQLWEVFFWYHNIERGLGGAEALKAHPWWFYLQHTATDLFPWSLALPAAIYWFWRRRSTRRDDDAQQGLLWLAAMLLFLSCMRFKRADYFLPAYPGLALFLGACAERWWGEQTLVVPLSKSAAHLRTAFFAVLLMHGGGWLVYQAWFVSAPPSDWPYRNMAQAIRRQTQGPIIFFRAEQHLLAYHVGKPLDTILEWENLDIWAKKPFPVYVVMPAKDAQEWPDHLPAGALHEVLRSADYVHGARDLVVLCNRPSPE
jgi:4-amino-4-deoxy-L-arabinose transferase-like glycosyltransferase